MIISYRDKRTSEFAAGNRVRAFSGIEQAAQLKIDRLEAATALQDLAALPGNRFEALKGKPQVSAGVIHPGVHLAGELEELEMSAAELARRLAAPASRVTQILNGHRGITGDTALRLAHFFGSSPDFWLNLQKIYELRLAERKVGKMIKSLPTLEGEAVRV